MWRFRCEWLENSQLLEGAQQPTREAAHVILTHDSLRHKATVSAVMRTFVDMLGRQVSQFAPKTLIVLERKQILRSRRSSTLSAQPAKKSMPDRVVICGGGIIGVATAYYLALQGIKPLLVEKSGIACAASGPSQAEAKYITACLVYCLRILGKSPLHQKQTRCVSANQTKFGFFAYASVVSVLCMTVVHCTALHRQSWRFLGSGLD